MAQSSKKAFSTFAWPVHASTSAESAVEMYAVPPWLAQPSAPAIWVLVGEVVAVVVGVVDVVALVVRVVVSVVAVVSVVVADVVAELVAVDVAVVVVFVMH